MKLTEIIPTHQEDDFDVEKFEQEMLDEYKENVRLYGKESIPLEEMDFPLMEGKEAEEVIRKVESVLEKYPFPE